MNQTNERNQTSERDQKNEKDQINEGKNHMTNELTGRK
jgi:hypothetical protein